MEYLHFDEKKLADFSDKTVADMYDRGYVFTRLGRGVMQQTRSIRIDLNKFELSSENRRILRKGENISVNEHTIPFSEYSWNIGKMAKDFYDVKASGAFSANKIKELVTSDQGFNLLFSFTDSTSRAAAEVTALGYAITYRNSTMLHYSYPFYDLAAAPKDMGLIMMTKTLVQAKEAGLKYVYLGSLQRPSDTYKLQFSGAEWFDGGETGTGTWSTDAEKVKIILNGK